MSVSGTIKVTLKSEHLSLLARAANCLTQNTMNFGELSFDIDSLPDIPENKVQSVVYELFVFDGPRHIYRRRYSEKLADLREDLLLIQKRCFPNEWYSKRGTFIPQPIQVHNCQQAFNEGIWPPTY